MQVNLEIIEAFKKTINEESSDRAKVIITAAQIDYLLDMKLKDHFSHGNKNVQKKLFSGNGAFSTLSSKVNIAYCSGWIDSDVYHDIEVLRKIRNVFAHRFEALSLDSPDIIKLIKNFQVPHRQYYDWGKLRIASSDDGIVMYTGDKPDGAKEDFEVPGKLFFVIGMSILYTVLLENLGFSVKLSDGKIIEIALLDHMKN